MWQAIDSQFVCQITSPKKETKYRGMKSFIAYQITPSVSVHVSFDNLLIYLSYFISLQCSDVDWATGMTSGQCLKWSKKEAGSLPQSKVECPSPEFLNLYLI